MAPPPPPSPTATLPQWGEYLQQKEQDTGALLSRAQALQQAMAAMAAGAGGDPSAAAALAEMGRLVEELGVAAAEARASAAQLRAETGKRSSAQVGAGRGAGCATGGACSPVRLPVCCCRPSCRHVRNAQRAHACTPAPRHRPTWPRAATWR